MPHGIEITHEVIVHYQSGPQRFRGTLGYCREIRASAIEDGTAVSGIKELKPPEPEKFKIDLPYDLDEDPDGYLSGNERGAFLDVDTHPHFVDDMEYALRDLIPGGLTTEEMVARVFLVTALLKQAYPHRPLSHCLTQARVWEFG